MNIYAIKDAKLGAYENLMTIKTDGVAIRLFGQEANNPQSTLNKHPADYDLYRIGRWDDRTGMLHPQEPELVIRAIQLIATEGEQHAS